MTARLVSFRSGHVPTSEELGETLLHAAAVGNRSKLKKIIDSGVYSVLPLSCKASVNRPTYTDEVLCHVL